MRINVYAEEIRHEVEMAFKTTETLKTYTGLRFYLESSDKLHHTIGDDDRSAVTFWAKPDKLRKLLQTALQLLEQYPEPTAEAEQKKVAACWDGWRDDGNSH